MGKHNLRRIVNLQKWEPMILQQQLKTEQINEGQGYLNILPKSADRNVSDAANDEKQGGLYSGVTNPVEGTNNSSLSIPLCLSPESLKRDELQLEQLKYRKLK